MFRPIKIYSTVNAEIKPGATVVIPTESAIEVPVNAVGKFFVRLCYGSKGLVSPDSPFKPGFTGKPKDGIVLINNGPNVIYIPKGGEIGEIYMLALAPIAPESFSIDVAVSPIVHMAREAETKMLVGIADSMTKFNGTDPMTTKEKP